MHALLTIAADTTSKVPFYVAGLLLAGWAVLLSFFGLRQPTFPANGAAQRGVIGVSAVLMVAAVATAIITA